VLSVATVSLDALRLWEISVIALSVRRGSIKVPLASRCKGHLLLLSKNINELAPGLTSSTQIDLAHGTFGNAIGALLYASPGADAY